MGNTAWGARGQGDAQGKGKGKGKSKGGEAFIPSDAVVATAGFASADDVFIPKGLRGIIIQLNEEGSALVDFDGPQKREWVSKPSLKFLQKVRAAPAASGGGCFSRQSAQAKASQLVEDASASAKSDDPQVYPPGTAVEYLSLSKGCWVPAVVQSFSDGGYKLDATPNVVLCQNVRPAESQRQAPQAQGLTSHMITVTVNSSDDFMKALGAEAAKYMQSRGISRSDIVPHSHSMIFVTCGEERVPFEQLKQQFPRFPEGLPPTLFPATCIHSFDTVQGNEAADLPKKHSKGVPLMPAPGDSPTEEVEPPPPPAKMGKGYPNAFDGHSQSSDGYPQPSDGYPQPSDSYPQPSDGYPQPSEDNPNAVVEAWNEQQWTEQQWNEHQWWGEQQWSGQWGGAPVGLQPPPPLPAPSLASLMPISQAQREAEAELKRKSDQITAVSRQIEAAKAELQQHQQMRSQQAAFGEAARLEAARAAAAARIQQARELIAGTSPELESMKENLKRTLQVSQKLDAWFVENAAQMSIQDPNSTPSAFLQRLLESCDRRLEVLSTSIGKTLEGGSMTHQPLGSRPGVTPAASMPGGTGVTGMWVRDPDAEGG
jgi:hypothetical protein